VNQSLELPRRHSARTIRRDRASRECETKFSSIGHRVRAVPENYTFEEARRSGRTGQASPLAGKVEQRGLRMPTARSEIQGAAVSGCWKEFEADVYERTTGTV